MPAIVVTAFALGYVGAAATPAPLLGNQAIEANADYEGPGTAEAFQATATASGSGTDIYLYLDSTPPTKVIAGIYAEAAGHPGALLAQGTLAAPKGAAWNDVPLTAPVSLSTGTKYWLAVLSPSGSGTVRFRDRKASGSSEASSVTTLTALPATWKTGTRYSDGFLSAYVLPGGADTSAPTQPQAFVTTAQTASTISASWTASTDNVGVVGYNAYVGSQKLGSTQGTSYSFASLACGTGYTLGVEAYDAAGNVSPRATLSASTSSCPDTTPPTTPTAFHATGATTSSISTAWTASTDAVGVVGYDVYVGTQKIGTTGSTAFTFSGLSCGQTVPLGVAAFDAAGNRSALATTSASASACPDTSPPTQPQAFGQIGATGSSASTSWTASTDNVGVTGYTVYLGGQPVAATASTSYTFGGLACGSSYPAGVEAYDAAGNVSVRAALTVVTASCPDTSPPSTPASFLVTGTSGASISTFWTASADDIGVVGYDVYADGAQVGVTSGTTYQFTGLTCGQVVTLAVDAYDAAGNRSARATLTAATGACGDQSPPTTPDSFQATGATTDSIGATWAAATDNVGVAGYNLYVGTVRVGTTVDTSYNFGSLACGTAYVLGLEAYDAAGNVSQRSTLSASTLPCPDVTPPTQPTSLAATVATSTSVTVSWTASTDDSGVNDYNVYLDGQEVGATQSTSYTFSSLTCGTSHTAGVEANDAAGNVSTRATVQVATAACPDTSSPAAPADLLVTSSTRTAITAIWSASSDNVGVTGYQVALDGALLATVTTTSYTFSGLVCGTAHTLAVAAYDAAGNVSQSTTLPAMTAACPDTSPPTVAISSPVQNATLAGTSTLTATAADDVGVASVSFLVDGSPIGPVLTAAPYSWTWDARTVANGLHQLTAVATDAAGNSATSAPVSVSVVNALDTANALKAVTVGPGFTDASTRELVRTVGDRVYMFVADDTSQRLGTGPGVIHAYRADQTGVPTSFGEADATSRPAATGSTHVLGAPDVRLDRSGVVHLVYINDTDRSIVYRTFSTFSDTWGPPQVLGTNGDAITSDIKREGNAAIVLDQNDIPHVVYSTGSSLVYRNRIGGQWSAPLVVTSGGAPVHPQLACDAAGTLYLAWLQDGTSPSIHFKSLPSGGSWGPDEAVATTDVLDNSNSDQGPSIVLTATGVPYVLYVSSSKIWTNGANYGAVRVRYRTSSGWSLDSIPSDLLTHTPQIYAQGDDIYAFLGHDTNIHFGYAWKAAAGAWSPYTTLYAGTTVDGSASVRWDPQRETNANVIDAGFYDEDINNDKSYLPRAYYMAVLPRGGQPSQAPDTSPPVVSVSAPNAGSTVSGAVTVAASATDDVGVVGVQFTLDGNPLGAEDTAAPFSVPWNTASVANGSHMIGAIARDAAGNTASASTTTVTVNNVPDTTPPTVSITTPSAGATVSGAVTVTATASDAVGVAGVQFTLDGTLLGAEDTTAPYTTSWTTTTASVGSHVLGATARDGAGNRASASPVTVTVSAQAPFLIGDQTLETGGDNDGAGKAEAFSTVAAASGVISFIRVYVDSPAPTKLIVGVYTNNGSHPGVLLGQGTITAPSAAAWNTVTVSSVNVVAGTTYWIALLSPSGSGTIRFRARLGSGGPTETSSSGTLTALPATWVTGSTYRDGPFSAYGGS